MELYNSTPDKLANNMISLSREYRYFSKQNPRKPFEIAKEPSLYPKGTS